MSTEETLSREAIEEFKSLWHASGWKSHAEAGRKLELSRSVIGKFLSGETRPSAGTLKLFKLILFTEKPEALTAAAVLHGSEHLKLSEWERQLIAELRGLSEEDRERVLNAVKAFVAGLPKKEQPPHQKPTPVPHHRAVSSQEGEKKPMETIFPKGSRGPRVRPILPPSEEGKASSSKDTSDNPGPVERATRQLMDAARSGQPGHHK